MIDVDLVGIGVGPANLALLTAMLDARDEGQRLPSGIFLERSPAFTWHPGMMLPKSRVQVPFLKDLATQRNPRSRYTFLNFLFEQGRLEQFINLRDFHPALREFSEYMSWVAARAAPLIKYDTTVTKVRPTLACNGRIERIEVTAVSRASHVKTYRARAIVIATGCRPIFPMGMEDDGKGRIAHTSSLRMRVVDGLWARDAPSRFLIVGGGQSAAEAACFLLDEFLGAHVENVTASLPYRRKMTIPL